MFYGCRLIRCRLVLVGELDKQTLLGRKKMNTDIYINLDCGAELQITKIGDRFQVLEIVSESDGWRKQKARVIGRLHNTIIGAVNEVRNFALAQYEVLSLTEMESAINSTNQAIKDYFDQHNEYLANVARDI